MLQVKYPYESAIGVALSFVIPMIAYFMYAAVAMGWIIPDIRLERALNN